MPTEIRFLPINNQTVELVTTQANEWVWVSVKKETSGEVTLGTKKPLNDKSGTSLIEDTPIQLMLAPGTTLFVQAGDSQEVSCIIQPLPFIVGFWTMFSKLLGYFKDCG
jgi:hypothetical protein